MLQGRILPSFHYMLQAIVIVCMMQVSFLHFLFWHNLLSATRVIPGIYEVYPSVHVTHVYNFQFVFIKSEWTVNSSNLSNSSSVWCGTDEPYSLKLCSTSYADVRMLEGKIYPSGNMQVPFNEQRIVH